MELKHFTDFSEINHEDWDALLAQSETDFPFLRYGYQKSWWDFKGGGEWPQDADLHLIAGYQKERLAAIAPLFSSTTTDENILRLVGSIEISDYLDLICPYHDKKEFLSLLLNFIHSEMNEIRQIDLVNIPEKSTTIELLKVLSGDYGWAADIQPAYHTPVIPLAQNWETYLAGIDKKQRHEIRRKLRRADENAETVKWYISDNRETLSSEIDAFFTLMEMDADKKKFLTLQMKAQMSDIIRWAFEEGYLQLSFMQIDGKNASAYLCFDYGRHLLVYNSGFDFSFGEYSPGWVLLSYLIQHAINTGKSYFDFMRGDENYKYRFGAQDGVVVRALLERV
jgi:predicted N-acyltransferase